MEALANSLGRRRTMVSIPVTIVHTFDWLNAGLLAHPQNGDKHEWLGLDLGQETACRHHDKISYYTDDLAGMYGICNDCGDMVPEWM
jgi:hypothetical protein